MQARRGMTGWDDSEEVYWYIKIHHGLFGGDWRFAYIACQRWSALKSKRVSLEEQCALCAICALFAGQRKECVQGFGMLQNDPNIPETRRGAYKQLEIEVLHAFRNQDEIRGMRQEVDYAIDTGLVGAGMKACKICKRYIDFSHVCPLCLTEN
jgi:hypothetical protein